MSQQLGTALRPPGGGTERRGGSPLQIEWCRSRIGRTEETEGIDDSQRTTLVDTGTEGGCQCRPGFEPVDYVSTIPTDDDRARFLYDPQKEMNTRIRPVGLWTSPSTRWLIELSRH